MKQGNDNDFFDQGDENDPLAAGHKLQHAIREAYERRARAYAIKHGDLEEDEIETLFDTFEKLETFVKDTDKLRRKAARQSRIVEDDDETGKDFDPEDNRVSVKDNTKLLGSDRELGDLRVKESAFISKRTSKSKLKKEDTARSSTFKDLPESERPTAEEYRQMLDLMSEAGEEADV